MVHTLGSGEALHYSASAATGSPLVGWLSMRVSPQLRPVMKQTWEVHLAGSSTSVLAPPWRPTFRWPPRCGPAARRLRSEEHTSELQSLMRISYAVFCLKKKKNIKTEQ